MKKKTQEEWKQEVYDLVGDEYTVLGEYERNDKSVLMRHNCDKCNNYEFPMRPRNFKLGNRCPKCAGNVKKTHEEFIQEVYDLVGDEYTILGTYENNKKEVLIRHNCDKCNNNEFPMKPNKFLMGQRCPECFGTHKKEHDKYLKEVYDLVGDEYTILGKYKTNKTGILTRHNCNECNNYEWEISPVNFKNGNRCPKCAGVAKKSQEEWIKEVYDLVGDEYTILGNYINNRTGILTRHNCNECNNYEWEISPNNFQQGYRCPKCAELNNISKGEEIIKEYLSNNNYSFIHHHTFEDCRNKKPLIFDFYLKEENLIIEFDGEQHYDKSSQYYDPEQQKRDRIKDQYCLDNNITILRIAYKELNNLEDILDSWFENGILSTTDNILLYENGEKIIQGVYKDIIE